MIEMKQDRLVFQFPEVHEDAICKVDFQRTFRIPDDNKTYHLPPGTGRFPLEHVEDHASRLPPAWNERGGVMLPMYQAEALWIHFSGGGALWEETYPFAVKIAAGKINAVTGDEWSNDLDADPHNYLVVPNQPWLDGFCVQKGLIRQFVAMPLGQGYTAEEQISGTAEHGGLQIIVYPMKRDYYERLLEERAMQEQAMQEQALFDIAEDVITSEAMGLAPGGLMRQEVYEDPYGYDAWDTSVSSRCFVHILNSTHWAAVTDKPMPGKPPSDLDYMFNGLPWFDYYDESLDAVDGSEKLAGMDSVAAKGVKLGELPLPDNGVRGPEWFIDFGPPDAKIKDGKW